jgi:CheY-like chemotaxis protein
VFIVDDDVLVADLLSEMFRAEGCEVSVAHDGQQAIQALRAAMAEMRRRPRCRPGTSPGL